MSHRRISFATLVTAVVGTGLSLCVTVAPAHALDPAPTDLQMVSSTATRMTIAWNPSGSPSYRIHYATDANFSSNLKGATTTSTTYVLSSLQPNTTYYFRVAGLDGSTYVTGWSGTASGRTKPLMKFSVASFNIKDPDSTAQGPWTTRGPRSAAAVVGQAVRLLGVQELYENGPPPNDERQQFLDYVNSAAGGPYYDMVPKPAEDAGKDSRILFDTRAFMLVSPTSYGAVQYASQARKSDGSIETRRWFSWAKLRHKATGKYILFVTTHLSPRSDTVDIAQWRQLIGWLKAVRTANPSYKFIVAGDFNATKFEKLDDGQPVAQLASMRSNGFEDVLGQTFRSYSTYRNPSVRVDSWIGSSNQGLRDVRANGGSVAPGKNSNSIDYVFVSKVLKATYYRVYAQPRTGYIMNYLTSDHFMVRAAISE